MGKRTCRESDTREIEQTLKARMREQTHLMIYTLHIVTEHLFNSDNVESLECETDRFKRGVKEVVFIRTLKPSLTGPGGNVNSGTILRKITRKLSG